MRAAGAAKATSRPECRAQQRSRLGEAAECRISCNIRVGQPRAGGGAINNPLPKGSGSVQHFRAGTIPRPRRVTNLVSAAGLLACGLPGRRPEDCGLENGSDVVSSHNERCDATRFRFPHGLPAPITGGSGRCEHPTAYSCGAAPDFNRIPLAADVRRISADSAKIKKNYSTF